MGFFSSFSTPHFWVMKIQVRLQIMPVAQSTSRQAAGRASMGAALCCPTPAGELECGDCVVCKKNCIKTTTCVCHLHLQKYRGSSQSAGLLLLVYLFKVVSEGWV